MVLIMGSLSAQGLRITQVDPNTNEITLTNYGSAMDYSMYRLCSLFDYDPLASSDVTIVDGSFNLGMGESVTFTWMSGGMSASGADLGLYLPSGSFGSADNMIDFVQWGSAGNGREAVADAAGIWTAGDFLTVEAPYAYNGDGVQTGIAFWGTANTGGDSSVVINEIDCDNTGTDTMEFIELYGEPNESLDGLVIVFLNGNGDVAYNAIDLDGYSTDENGFFVAGNAAIAEADVVFSDNSLQNGADAVAVYYGNASDWENGTPATADNLIDMAVYSTGDADDVELLAFLNEGQLQLDEWANGFEGGQVESLSRVPDGGTPLNTDTYVTQPPTPGASNVIPCLGGSVSTDMDETEVVACVNEIDFIISFMNTSTSESDYLYVITDESNIIIDVTSEPSYNFGGAEEGMVRVWGLSYTGTLDDTTIEPGDDATMIMSDDCLSLSSNFIAVSLEDCTPATCDGATIDSDQGSVTVVVCLDEEADEVSFSNNSNTDLASYTYVLTTVEGIIIDTFESGTYDFNNGEEQTCNVYGLSYTGTLTDGALDAGNSIFEATTDGDCISISENFITIVKQECVTEGGCTDLLISEYLEGSSNNKAIEIYNPTDFTVDLSEYEVLLYPNGATEFNNNLVLEGTLAPGEVYVIANANASPLILAEADITATVTFFNGNDALELTHNGVVIDVIGVVGENPEGEVWVVGEGATAEYTLVRKVEVTSGTDDWLLSSTQWDVYPQDYLTSLGNHTSFPCVLTPQVGFTASSLNIDEAAGTATFGVQAFNLEADLEVTITLTGGTATDVDDYSFTSPQVVTILADATDPQTFDVTIVDDAIEEDTETIIFTLTNNDGVEISTGELTINILDNDAAIEVLTIAEAAEIDEDGVIVNDNLECEIRGIVHGVNMRPGGLQFTLIDDTDGIGVFSSSENFGYTVLEGDSVHIVGTLGQFNGLAQINVSAVDYISSDNEIDQPLVVTELNEDTESHVIKLECVSIIDPSEWSPGGSGFTVTVTDGTNEYDVRIDADVELFNEPAPQGSFDIAGIGGQFDSSSPYDSGYQLLPRYNADLTPGPVATFTYAGDADGTTLDLSDDQTVNMSATADLEGADSYTWELAFGEDVFPNAGSPALYNQSIIDTQFPDEVTLTLTIEVDGCTATETVTFDNVIYTGIEEAGFELLMYPNPARNSFNVESSSPLESIRVFSQTGQLVKLVSGEMNNRLVVDLSDLAEGIYMVEVTTEKGVQVNRLIKE